MLRSHWWTSLYIYIKANVVSVCLFVCLSVTDICGQGSGMKKLYVRPSVSPSVHPSFFPSLTSPSSLAPFSVSLIYIFLVSFSGNHVIGLLNMCSNVHTTAYMQLLDFFYCQIFCQFCTWNIWFQISTYLKDFSWKINGPKLARLCGKKSL
jgi:hypothetical protein